MTDDAREPAADAQTPVIAKALGRFKRGPHASTDGGPGAAPPFPDTLARHFGMDPTDLPVVAETFQSWDRPNVQVAVEAFLEREGGALELIGVSAGPRGEFNLAAVAGAEAGFARCPVRYDTVHLDGERSVPCVQRGVYLARSGVEPVALAFASSMRSMIDGRIELEVMARRRDVARAALDRIREIASERNVYRGHAISLESDACSRAFHVKFHRLPRIGREEIILPDGLIERIERPTVRFAEHREKLRRAGRHLKRGVLLHGPPGTGKTLTAMYLAGRMPDRTVLMMTGRGLAMIEQSCRMARMLEPATVIVEDVDLVARERDQGRATALLFELLNAMDGLADDADLLFLLTTNRPEVLEPALCARPGRIDQAIEIPLPDAACRRRLFALYARGLDLRANDLEHLVARTEGATASFIRELVRRAALLAAEDGADIVVTDRHLDVALHELALNGDALTARLLGAQLRPTGDDGPIDACACPPPGA